jgi:hypothetical protein
VTSASTLRAREREASLERRSALQRRETEWPRGSGEGSELATTSCALIERKQTPSALGEEEAAFGVAHAPIGMPPAAPSHWWPRAKRALLRPIAVAFTSAAIYRARARDASLSRVPHPDDAEERLVLTSSRRIGEAKSTAAHCALSARARSPPSPPSISS